MFSIPTAYVADKKTCKQCSTEKPTYDFSPSKAKCKECQAKHQKAYRKQVGGDSNKKWGRFVFGNNIPSEVRSLCFTTEASK